MRGRALARLALALGVLAALSGCASLSSWQLPAISIPEPPSMPAWVPLVGSKPTPRVTVSATPLKDLAEKRQRLPDDQTMVDRVICVVNNDAVTLYELDEAEAAFLHESRVTPPEGDERRALRDRLLGNMIQQRIQLQQAEREKIPVDDAEVAAELADIIKKVGAANERALDEMLRAQGLTPERFRKRLREQLMVQKLTRRKVVLRISVTEQEIDRYLRENTDKLETGLTFEARHMLFLPGAGEEEAAWEAARRRAEVVHAQLLEGKDFAELARQHSEDGSGQDGGSLGTLKRGELAPDIEKAILALEIGQTSTPFRSGVGFHLFRLDTRQTLSGEALTQARNQIRDILFREKYEVRMKEWLAEMRERAVIDIRL